MSKVKKKKEQKSFIFSRTKLAGHKVKYLVSDPCRQPLLINSKQIIVA